MAIRQAYCEYVRFILVSLFESQTTVLKCPQTAIEAGRAFLGAVVQLTKRIEGTLSESLRTPTARGLHGPPLGRYGTMPTVSPFRARSSSLYGSEGDAVSRSALCHLLLFPSSLSCLHKRCYIHQFSYRETGPILLFFLW